MNIVAQNHQSRELLSSKISHFLEKFHVGRILKACNAYKVRGFSVKDVFQVAFENAFSNKSFFQKQREYSNCIPFAKDTFYRFMGSVRYLHCCKSRILATMSLAWSRRVKKFIFATADGCKARLQFSEQQRSAAAVPHIFFPWRRKS